MLFFQFESIINILVISFRFIWIPMLWVYAHYTIFNSFIAGVDFLRRNLASTEFEIVESRLDGKQAEFPILKCHVSNSVLVKVIVTNLISLHRTETENWVKKCTTIIIIILINMYQI